MKEISLTKGKVTLVDEEDYAELSKYKWCCHPKGYACRRSGDIKNVMMMHTQIINTPKGMETDHINGNKLDNQRKNLRICTRGENARNCKKPTMGKNHYKGVSWHKDAKKWEAYIHFKDRKYHLALCRGEKDAVIYYNVAAQILFGKFARLNFIS